LKYFYKIRKKSIIKKVYVKCKILFSFSIIKSLTLYFTNFNYFLAITNYCIITEKFPHNSSLDLEHIQHEPDFKLTIRKWCLVIVFESTAEINLIRKEIVNAANSKGNEVSFVKQADFNYARVNKRYIFCYLYMVVRSVAFKICEYIYLSVIKRVIWDIDTCTYICIFLHCPNAHICVCVCVCMYIRLRLCACKWDRGSKKQLARGAKLTHKRGRNTLDLNRFQHGDDDSKIMRGKGGGKRGERSDLYYLNIDPDKKRTPVLLSIIRYTSKSRWLKCNYIVSQAISNI